MCHEDEVKVVNLGRGGVLVVYVTLNEVSPGADDLGFFPQHYLTPFPALSTGLSFLIKTKNKLRKEQLNKMILPTIKLWLIISSTMTTLSEKHLI